MLVELKQRLRETSDLNAAGDVLNWDQATYMPEGGDLNLPSEQTKQRRASRRDKPPESI